MYVVVAGRCRIVNRTARAAVATVRNDGANRVTAAVGGGVTAAVTNHLGRMRRHPNTISDSRFAEIYNHCGRTRLVRFVTIGAGVSGAIICAAAGVVIVVVVVAGRTITAAELRLGIWNAMPVR